MIWGIIGFTAGYLKVFAPIHETGHAIMAILHLRPFRMYWSSMWIDDPTWLIVAAGYSFELLVFAFIYSKWRHPFVKGLMIEAIIIAYFSRDMTLMMDLTGLSWHFWAMLWTGYWGTISYLLKKDGEFMLKLRRRYG